MTVYLSKVVRRVSVRSDGVRGEGVIMRGGVGHINQRVSAAI